ncbi:MAG: endonuclease domain-containing protein [Patescibacteria group bacterium]|jgi:very-short-patch-repair endonuclease
MYIRSSNRNILQYDQKLRWIAKSLRKNATDAELILWQELRTRKLGYKFRRQHALHGYIVDFYCYEKMLVIEVDGSIHNMKNDHDHSKDDILKLNGFKVIRFTNEVVICRLAEVINTIQQHLTQ